MNKRAVQTWLEWKRNSERAIDGVAVCLIRFYLPLGLLIVMDRADKVPAGRIDTRRGFLSNGFVSSKEMEAAAILIGKRLDIGKPDTYGLIKGQLVVVDYGWPDPDETLTQPMTG